MQCRSPSSDADRTTTYRMIIVVCNLAAATFSRVSSSSLVELAAAAATRLGGPRVAALSPLSPPHLPPPPPPRPISNFVMQPPDSDITVDATAGEAAWWRPRRLAELAASADDHYRNCFALLLNRDQTN